MSVCAPQYEYASPLALALCMLSHITTIMYVIKWYILSRSILAGSLTSDYVYVKYWQMVHNYKKELLKTINFVAHQYIAASLSQATPFN